MTSADRLTARPPDRRGFALLAVLWLLVALTAVGGVSLAAVRIGAATTRNRVLLARAGWAREACEEILLARYARQAGIRSLEPIDLGRGTWCTARLEDPQAKLNLNVADLEALRTVVHAGIRGPPADSIVAAILRSRPLVDVGQLADLTGVDSATLSRLDQLLTTRGSGQINVNAASEEVLRAVPGLTEESRAAILTRRAMGHPIASADELTASVSPSARNVLYADYQEFIRSVSFAPSQLLVHLTGGVRDTRLQARGTLTVVPLPDRLAVVRREAE